MGRRFRDVIGRLSVNQKKHTKAEDSLLFTNEGEKLKKRRTNTENSQNTLLSRRLVWKRQS